jgi:predicted Zn-dependent protease with MMP-like domain
MPLRDPLDVFKADVPLPCGYTAAHSFTTPAWMVRRMPTQSAPIGADVWKGRAAPSLEDFEALANEAFAGLPDEFRTLTGDVVFQVADFGDEALLKDLGIQDPFELSGLYDGQPLSQRSVFQTGVRPSMIFLYRRPILDEWAERGDLSLLELVTHVLVHEIGHHFGLTDGDIHAIEDEGD